VTNLIAARIERKLEKPKAMYEALSTAYSLVYRGAKSPFSEKWSLEDHLVALGNNEELGCLLHEVVEYDRRYCKQTASFKSSYSKN
jgi:hypothetical protein